MASQEEIDDQQALLAAHRRMLAHLLIQRASFDPGLVPSHLAHGIAEARAAIQRCTATLRGWGVAVEDHPDDAVPSSHSRTSSATPSLRPHPEPPPLPPLGEPLSPVRAAVFPVKRWNILGAFGCTVALLGVGGFLAIFAIVALIAALVGSAAPPSQAAPWALVGVLFLAGGWSSWRSVSRLRTTCIHVFADRLEYHTLGHVAVYRWDDVTAVWQVVIKNQDDNPIRYCYALKTYHPAQLTIDQSFQDQAALEAAIRAGVRAPLMRRARATYQAHGEVPFGPQLTVNQQGVGFGGDHITWSYVEEVGWNEYVIWLRRTDALEAQPLDLTGPGTANFFIFAEFVNAIIAAQRRASAQR